MNTASIVNSPEAERLRRAWAALPPDMKAAIEPMFDDAHDQVRTFALTGRPTHRPEIPHQLLLAKTVLTHDREALVPKLPPPQASASPHTLGPGASAALFAPGTSKVAVSPGGDIYGTSKYQILDPGWVESAAIWLEHLLIGRHSFPVGTPRITPVADDFTMGIAGDWGTGPYGAAPGPSVKVANVLAGFQADYNIHLGDVYYAGTGNEETNNFVNLWPAGSKGSFALNSNHEMYSGGGPYFAAVSGGKFSFQASLSYFALENTYWIIIGLDSAYFSNELKAYTEGGLGSATKDPQVTFLQQVASRAHTENKQVMLLTHHNGLKEDGSATTGLWNEVMAAFPVGTAPAYWYWGHVHAGIVYAQQANGVRGRCSGHSALPQGFASELQNNNNVLWFESRNAGDPSDTLRVLNGCTLLKFSGESVVETFFDENGNQAWTSAQRAGAST